MSTRTGMPVNQAAWLDGKGQKLRVAEAAMPTAEEGEIVIRNHAIALNPVSCKMQDTGIVVQSWPAILDYDVAGKIHEVGPGVARFRRGDRVVAFVTGPVSPLPKYGAFQLYSVVRAGQVAILPNDVPFSNASVLPVAFNTAIVGLCAPPPQGMGLPFPSLSPQPADKPIIIWGASSAVGLQSTQVATAAGVKVIAVASAHNFEICRSCGAVEVLDYHSSSIHDDVVKAVHAAGGKFVGVLDCISLPESLNHSVPILEELGGGVLGVLVPHAQPKVTDRINFIHILGMSEMTDSFWQHYITPALQQGKLKCLPEPLVIGDGLEWLQKGLDILRAGVSARKVVITL